MRAAVAVIASLIAGNSLANSACSNNTSTPPKPVLKDRYVLVSANTLAPNVMRDANGDSIRVYADTLYFIQANVTYAEATRVGRFKGFAAESISVEHVAAKAYVLSSDGTKLTLASPILGSTMGIVGSGELLIPGPTIAGVTYDWLFNPR